jgi:hypothetical protein
MGGPSGQNFPSLGDRSPRPTLPTPEFLRGATSTTLYTTAWVTTHYIPHGVAEHHAAADPRAEGVPLEPERSSTAPRSCR